MKKILKKLFFKKQKPVIKPHPDYLVFGGIHVRKASMREC